MEYYDELVRRLRWFAEEPDSSCPNLCARAATVIEGLAEHEAEGGIAMQCGHPVQALYADDDGVGHCRWCEEVKDGALRCEFAEADGGCVGCE